MTRDNQDALRLAESHQKIARMNGGIKSVFISQKSLLDSSTHLRRLVRENEELRVDRDSWADQASQRLKDWDELRQQCEAKDALLRQAVDHLDAFNWQEHTEVVAAIRQHLDKKTT